MDVPIFNIPQSVTIATVVAVTAAWKGTTSLKTGFFHQFSISYTFSSLFDIRVAFQNLEGIKVGKEVNYRLESSTALSMKW